MDIRTMTALEIGEKIQNREISSVEVTKAYLDSIKKEGGITNAYITVLEEEALKKSTAIQERINKGEHISQLAGVPVAIKDNICTQGIHTTAGSKMLSNFIPPYNATVIEKLERAGAIIIGKTNLDEFAMGGSTETSYFGSTKNPWSLDYVPGGSSGGSAAAVAARLAPYSLGSDTGGSIRQPCSFCNLTGIKPTYGSVSRYGLMAYASSLDQIGPIGRDVKDCAAALAIISGYDQKDSTSILGEPLNFNASFQEKIRGARIGIPKNYFQIGVSEDVKGTVLEAAKELQRLGAVVEEFEMPTIEYAVPAYYIIACAEASSNLSRYDGIKYGYRSSQAKDLLETFYKSRSEGFGKEVKRRIMLGSFVLSSGYFDAYYKKALQVRRLIKESFDHAFTKYEIILSPVSPTTSYKIGEQIADPLAMYLADIYTVSINLAGLPAVALPCGFGDSGMPIGMQLIGKAYSEERLIGIAHEYQRNTDYHKKSPRFGENNDWLTNEEAHTKIDKGGLE